MASRPIRVLSLAALLVALLASGPAGTRAAQREDTYTSPTYGYTLTYDPGDWEIVEGSETSRRGVDQVFLGHRDLPTEVRLIAATDYRGDPEACLAGFVEGVEAGEGVEAFEPLERRGRPVEGELEDGAGVFAAYAVTFVGEDGPTELVDYVECRVLVEDEANLIVFQVALAEAFREADAAREDLLEGLELPEAEGSPDRDDDRRGGDEETYESPQYGYTLTYDPDEWEVTAEDEDPDDPYDRVFLSNGTSLVGVIGDPTYDEDELADCVESYVRVFESGEGNSDVEPLDERGAVGEEADRAWATHAYTHEFEDGGEDDFIAFHECRWLGDGLTLVVYHAAPADVFEDEVEAREDLLEGFAPAEGAEDDDRDGDREADADRDEEDLLAEVETYEVYAGHVEGDVYYDPVPPVGGPHHEVWQDCGFYDEPVVEERAVHSLEHGAVWITYDPDLPADQVEILEELAEGETHVLASPYPDLPAPVVASAWGVQLLLDGADDPRLEAFVDYYQQGPQTPEPGAACSGGTTETA